MEHTPADIDEYKLQAVRKKVVSVDPNAQKKKPVTIQMTDGVLIPRKDDGHLLNSWRITFFSAITLLAALVLFQPKPYRDIFLVTIKGAPVTFQATIFAILGALVIGTVTGLGSVSKRRWVNMVSGVYVELIRGIPLLVQLIFIYYAMGRFFKIEGMIAAVAALSICFGAYMGEIVRAGIQAIPKGQMEAAIALGLSRSQAFRYVILPQTIKVVLPAIGNEFISMLKDSSLVSTIALSDILRKGREYISRTFLSLETMLVVALIYLIITLLLSRLVGILEERLHENG
ncbi:MAG: amino acid ABC transporter permease [Sphaerochaeta sp.]|jgi:polar amino acid transport system permease protein|uniref:amino acid ABC transporter permease n=1 Tax=unclassified Sphaerochaeta TaxID=2637943 RepID=UPI000E7DC5A6|nr:MULTISPECIES: amino acid ABC transporter permease [unclassified Sphaerochaeta]MCK9601152.1 amino acid ABC transporter permease [Sphaerochaeta sp.]MDX9824262.1 amino acid ABC transporter permease [Sphaerochaeta sp.]MEA4863808.1 amino acid ABC transporter permease [Sphaerochaeta sp.]HBO35745.1 amino acid ABC transporter permease [Sphaerochaeta sp.]HCU30252.1 amino acid ABC transporter permease [Sphaerochaeta sp.]